jgi:dUTPase
MQNTGAEVAEIKVGDRVAQMVMEKAPMIKFDVVENIALIKGNRGGGYGSTGV